MLMYNVKPRWKFIKSMGVHDLKASLLINAGVHFDNSTLVGFVVIGCDIP